eukprot:1040105-Rhodomonas_salina.2
MSGTDAVYGAMSCAVLTQCMVLCMRGTERGTDAVYGAVLSAVQRWGKVLRQCYAMSGTDVAH